MVKGDKALPNNKKALKIYQELYKINMPLLVVVLFAINFSIVNGTLFTHLLSSKSFIL